jgi:general secretion pathway protein E
MVFDSSKRGVSLSFGRPAAPSAAVPTLTDRAPARAAPSTTPSAAATEAPDLVLSGPGKPFALSPAQTRYCVVIHVGEQNARTARALVQHHYLTNHDLLVALDRYARATGYTLLPAEAAPPDAIRAHYRTSSVSPVAAGAVDRMRGRVLDIVTQAAAVRTSDIDVAQEGESAEVTFLLNGYKTPPVDRFDRADVPNFFSAAFNLGDHGDTVEIPHLDQKWTCTNAELLPAGVQGLRFNSGHLANGRVLNIRINYERLPNGHTGLQSLDLPMDIKSRLHTLLFETSGLFTIAGPTESGKTTTQTNFLLSMLAETQNSIKILSIADPPEGIYKGIWQFSIDEEMDQRGHTVIDRLVQTTLRMSPHYINFGEVRTHRMAEFLFIALSQGKGLLVTAHTFNGLDVPRRYAKLGVHPDEAYAPTNHSAILAQRLVPHLCEHCRRPLTAAAQQSDSLAAVYAQWRQAIGEHADRLYVRGPGCSRCAPEGVITQPGLTKRHIYPEIVDPDDHLFHTLRHKPLDARKEWLTRDGTSMRLFALRDLLEGRIGATEFTQFFQKPAFLQYDWHHHKPSVDVFGLPPTPATNFARTIAAETARAEAALP